MVLLTFLLVFVLVGIPMLCVALPLVGLAKICEARKKYVDALKSDQTPEHQPAVMVSKEDGRVIAMEVMEPHPIMPGTPPPQKVGDHMAAKVAKQVAARAAGAVAKHYLRIWLFGR